MPSSSPPSPAHNGGGDRYNDEEEEEIIEEVIEEIVKEEVEVDEDEEESRKMVNSDLPNGVVERHDDATQKMECEGLRREIRSISYTLEKPEGKQKLNTYSRENNSCHLNSSTTSDEQPIPASQEQAGVPSHPEKIKQMDTRDDKKRTVSRLSSSEMGTRSLSADIRTENGNKRLAMICEFYAKGWCIRGKSCRFLHVRDDAKITAQKPEINSSSSDQKGEIRCTEGTRDHTERVSSPGFPDPLSSSVGSYSAYSHHILSKSNLPLENAEHQKGQFDEKAKFSSEIEDSLLGIFPTPRHLPSSSEELGFISLKNVGRESTKEYLSSDGYGDYALPVSRVSPVHRSTMLPEHGSSINGSLKQSNIYCSLPSSYTRNLDGLSNRQSQMLTASLPASDVLLPHYSSPWVGSSSSSRLSSFAASTILSQSFLDDSKDLRTAKSLFSHADLSLFSGSEAAKSSLTNAAGVLKCSTERWTKFCPYNWKPSTPFRPSYLISSIRGATYDSLRNSSELPNIGDSSYRSCYTRGVSILNVSDKIHSNSGGNILGLQCTDGKHSDPSHDRTHGRVMEKAMEKDCYTHEENSLPTGADMEGNSVIDGQSGTVPEEDKPVDVAESRGATHQSTGFRHKIYSEKNLDKQNHKAEFEHGEDVSSQKEPKALQHFRAALIEYVKEMLNPTWRQGFLSRDAYKIIVKKASDKVISTMQLHQIPTSTESIKQYFSSSQIKITQLIEGYVEKYGKMS